MVNSTPPFRPKQMTHTKLCGRHVLGYIGSESGEIVHDVPKKMHMSNTRNVLKRSVFYI